MNEVLKLRKKPLAIEAMQWDGPDDDRRLGEFLSANGWGAKWCHNSDGLPCISTLESGNGFHIVSPEDYVIKGIAGEFYPCKPNIFALTYEPADTRRDPAEALAGKLAAAQDLIRTLWECGNFSQSVRNALSEDGRLRAALASYEAQKEGKRG